MVDKEYYYTNDQAIQASEKPLDGRPANRTTQHYPARIVGDYYQDTQAIKIIWDSRPGVVRSIHPDQIFAGDGRRKRKARNYYNEEDEEVSRIIFIIYFV